MEAALPFAERTARMYMSVYLWAVLGSVDLAHAPISAWVDQLGPGSASDHLARPADTGLQAATPPTYAEQGIEKKSTRR